MSQDAHSDARLGEHREAARALHERWVKEIVEGGPFCPFARFSRRAGRSVFVVSCGDVSSFEEAVLRVAASAAPECEVLQVVFPGVGLSAVRWRSQVQEVARKHAGLAQRWALAAFHPQHPGRTDSEGGVVGMLRRSPFPMVQLVALRTLADVRGDRRNGPVAAAVARQNMRVFGREGEHWAGRIDALVAEGEVLCARAGFLEAFVERHRATPG